MLPFNNESNKLENELKIITSELDPRIIFLGTSSARSTLTRNVSGILYQLKKNKE